MRVLTDMNYTIDNPGPYLYRVIRHHDGRDATTKMCETWLLTIAEEIRAALEKADKDRNSFSVGADGATSLSKGTTIVYTCHVCNKETLVHGDSFPNDVLIKFCGWCGQAANKTDERLTKRERFALAALPILVELTKCENIGRTLKAEDAPLLRHALMKAAYVFADEMIEQGKY